MVGIEKRRMGGGGGETQKRKEGDPEVEHTLNNCRGFAQDIGVRRGETELAQELDALKK